MGADTLALVPVPLGHEDGGGIVAESAAEKIEPGEGDRVFVGRIGLNDLQHFADDFVSALQGCTVWQEYCADVVALILVRHQATGGDLPQSGGDCDHADEQDQANGAAADDPGGAAGVAAGHAPTETTTWAAQTINIARS